jgi:hypothetical protein
MELLEYYFEQALDVSYKLSTEEEISECLSIIQDYHNMINKDEIENLYINGPVEDGDTLMGSSIRELRKLNCVVKCVIKGEYGANVLNYRGYHAYKLFLYEKENKEEYLKFIELLRNYNKIN